MKQGVRIIGCQPENSPEMTLSLEAGKITNMEMSKPTLSDGSAGGIEEGSITFPICQSVVDDTILASEREIAEGIKYIANKHHKIIEGAAGVALACLIKNKDQFMGRKVIIVLCGSNIDIQKFKELI